MLFYRWLENTAVFFITTIYMATKQNSFLQLSVNNRSRLKSNLIKQGVILLVVAGGIF